MIKILVIVFMAFMSVANLNAQSWDELIMQGHKLYQSGQLEEASKTYEKAKFLAEKAFGLKHENYAHSCNHLAYLYKDQGKHIEAEKLFIEAKMIYEKIFGKNDSDYANVCNGLGHVYKQQGKYSQAEYAYIEAKDIYEKISGKETTFYAHTCSNLANIWTLQGKYVQAEMLQIESKEIKGKLFGKDHQFYAHSCNNLAVTYRELGLEQKAETLYIEAKEILAKSVGKEHLDYAGACLNLASLYKNQKRYEESEILYLEAKSIEVKTLGKEHPFYIENCLGRANLYSRQEKYKESEALYLEAKNICERVFGKNHPLYASAIRGLAYIYYDQDLYIESENLFIEARNVYAKIFGKNHPLYASLSKNIGDLYSIQRKYIEATPFYMESSEMFLNQVQNNFPFHSEEEKTDIFKSFSDDFEMYNTFAIKCKKMELIGWLYNNNLITKGILFRSTQKMQDIVLKSKDTNVQNLFREWKSQKEYTAKISQMSIEDKEQKQIDEKAELIKVNNLEKKLSLVSENLATKLDSYNPTWQEIQKRLKKNEVAVEIIRIRWHEKKITDSVLYLALIIKNNTKEYPEMTLLPNGNELERESVNYYRNCIKNKKLDVESFNYFWKPLEKHIKNAKKVYFSPDGVYNQINLLTLYNSQSKHYLKDEINIQIIGNTRDIMRPKKKSAKKKGDYQLYLFGYPDYAGNKKKNDFDSAWSVIPNLVGTKIEIETIAKNAMESKVKYKMFTGQLANEENLKSIQDANILHIATHGFFNENIKDKENYKKILEGSGLLLANAELTLNKIKIDNGENGIFTAQEASILDLYQTDLVVLSACETGLGEVKNGEGVYGLQRAFQQAGAKSIIMSLWKVDDIATQKMMTLFYKNLLVKKQSKRKAFQNAQKTLQRQYSHPYYWGAFVIIGE